MRSWYTNGSRKGRTRRRPSGSVRDSTRRRGGVVHRILLLLLAPASLLVPSADEMATCLVVSGGVDEQLRRQQLVGAGERGLHEYLGGVAGRDLSAVVTSIRMSGSVRASTRWRAAGPFRTAEATSPGGVKVRTWDGDAQSGGGRRRADRGGGGHQWWYGIVGNDEYADPWLDEAFATYATDVHAGDQQAGCWPGSLPAAISSSMGYCISRRTRRMSAPTAPACCMSWSG